MFCLASLVLSSGTLYAETPRNADPLRPASDADLAELSGRSGPPAGLNTHQKLLLADLQPHRRSRTSHAKKEEDPNDYLQVVQPGSSSSAHRKAAIAEMPLGHLSAKKQAEVNHILKTVSFYRRLPTVTFEVNPRVYQYLIGNPDVTVSIWRAMKISKVELWQTGNDYEADAGDGTTGTIEVLHRSRDKNLVMCEGEYKSPLMTRSIEAKSVVMLTTSYSKDADGKHFVTHRADLFVQFPSQTMDTVARIFSKLTVSTTDRSFSEVSVFLRLMSVAMARRPDWIEGIARQLDGVSDQRREQLVTLAAHVYAETHKRGLGDGDRGEGAGKSPVAGGTGAAGSVRISSQPGRSPQRE
jgi:hypothetical protein